ncbi:MAG: DUF1549 domain-containing protein [Kiritimatiellae bacterium]|nr:DUF1549 domain-containing protein [Kiritimatiellia bacterium]
MKTFLTSIISFLMVLNIIAAPAPTTPKSAKDAKATASKPVKKAVTKATATAQKSASKAPATVAAPTNIYAAITMLSETNLYEIAGTVTPECQIDKIVFRKLSKMGIKPLICSDAVFVRRAFVDVIGTIPTVKEARDFIQDKDPNKRKALIDNLLERNEYADYWAMKWGDILKIKAEFPVNLWPNAAQAYHHWIRSSLRDNKPYDKFVREMLVSNGSNFRVGPVNFYRAVQNKTPEGLATVVALVFMGSRAENWPTNTLIGMEAFFSQITYKPTREWKEEVVFWDTEKDYTLQQEAIAAAEALATNVASSATNAVSKQATNAVAKQVTNAVPQVTIVPPVAKVPREGVFPDGKKVKLPRDRDPREIFADWLLTLKNP